MGYLKERIKHAVRFLHKRGFGVHSPFMFNLILNVIRDRDRTFDYPLEWEKWNLLSRLERKIFRLLSRLIRHLEVRRGTQDISPPFASDSASGSAADGLHR